MAAHIALTRNPSTDNTVHKRLLKPGNLLLETLNLLPTIQRPSIVQP
jgi:hypothetical protein